MGGRFGVWLMGVLALAGAGLLATETVVVAGPALHAHTHAAPRSHRHLLVSPAQMDSAEAVVARTVDERTIPGAALAIGVRGRILGVTSYGRIGWSDADESVSPDSTVYDLASLTKAVATTTAVLLLVQDGRIHLDDPVQRSLPEFAGVGKEKVTWRHLLTHTSGLPPAGHMRGKTVAKRLRSLLRTKLVDSAGGSVQYSDLSFIVLWTAAQHVAGEPLARFLRRRVWKPLGMTQTSFWPGRDCENCAPTLILKSGEPYRGKPSDPIAHNLGVPSGNAGLFSTAHDLARFAAMIANGGELNGVRILRPDLVRLLSQQVPHAGHRTMGWEAFCPLEDPNQQQACERPIAYGHTGWTGTSLWIDPVRGTWVVILSNRSYNVKRPPDLGPLRREVFVRVAMPERAQALGD